MTDETNKSRDIQETIKSERSRGKRRSTQAAEDERALLKKLRQLLDLGTERDFVEALRADFGITEASSSFSRLLQIWREQH